MGDALFILFIKDNHRHGRPKVAKQVDLPAGRDEHNNGHDDSATNRCAGGDRDLVHVARIRGDSAHLTALVVVDIFRGDVDVLQGHNAHDDALLRGDVLDFEFPFAGLQWWTLFEGLVAKEAVNDAEAQDVCSVRVPLDDD